MNACSQRLKDGGIGVDMVCGCGCCCEVSLIVEESMIQGHGCTAGISRGFPGTELLYHTSAGETNTHQEFVSSPNLPARGL